MKEILLTQGKKALVDDEDYEELNKYKWHARKVRNNFWAVRNPKRSEEKKIPILMHKHLMNTPKGMDTDHIDGNGLNNQRSNLRICTHAQNTSNRGKQKNNTSGFKGVVFHKPTLKWHAKIQVNGKSISLRYHDSKLEAYKAYCAACVKYHGEFANLK